MEHLNLFYVWALEKKTIKAPPGFPADKDGNMELNTYELEVITDNQEYAQVLCYGSDGKKVYSFSDAYYGQNG